MGVFLRMSEEVELRNVQTKEWELSVTLLFSANWLILGEPFQSVLVREVTRPLSQGNVYLTLWGLMIDDWETNIPAVVYNVTVNTTRRPDLLHKDEVTIQFIKF